MGGGTRHTPPFRAQARYSGLIDVLKFSESPMSEAAAGCSIWLAFNADEAAFAAQLEQAKGAGVKRVFAVFTADGPTAAPDADALKAILDASGLTYTVMRTGKTGAARGGGGLKICEMDAEDCDVASKEDLYRFITEALSLPEAEGRLFSLCPSEDASQLKEMRLAGCGRREEAQALLAGVITERAAETLEAEKKGEPTAEEVEAEAKSTAETEAEREEELKMLLARAKERGLEAAKQREAEEAEKAKQREERRTYFQQSEGGEDEEGKDGGDGGDGDVKGESPPPPPSPPPEGGDGDSSGGDEPPLALA